MRKEVTGIRGSGYLVIRFFLLVLLIPTSVLADEVPRFYADEVVVTAVKRAHLKDQSPWDTEVITRKDIENSGAVKLGDILRPVSGIFVKSNGGLNSQISTSLRGSTNQQVLILLNGNRINSPTLGSFDLGSVLLTDVEKIEIVKAPLTALYGADAVGGVINIITRKPEEDRSINFSANYGSFSTHNLAISGQGPHYYFSASSVGTVGFLPNNDYNAQDINLRFSGNLGKANLEAGIKKYNDDKGVANATTLSRLTDNNLFYDIKCQLAEAGLKATFSQSILEMRNQDAWSNDTHNSLTSIFDIQKSFGLAAIHNFILGIELRGDNSNSTNSGIHLINNQALYLQDEIMLLDNLNIVLGGREDANAVYQDHFNPRIGFVLGLFSDLLLKASWGSSFRAPTMNDLYWTSSTYPTWQGGVGTSEGNPNIRPETAQTIDFTLEKKLDLHTSVRMTYFSSCIADMIQWANTATSLVDEYWTPSNVSSANIQGIEFDYRRSIYESLNTFINLNLQSAKDVATDKYLTYHPQTQINAGLRYEIQEGDDLNLIIKNVGERFTDAANINRLDGYTVVDLVLTKSIGKWTIKIDLENLFNGGYQETATYPMPGRSCNVGFSYNL
ncbi:MAG: TonB-dependent receptor [Candidatus Margulisiibacteriota bacterium]